VKVYFKRIAADINVPDDVIDDATEMSIQSGGRPKVIGRMPYGTWSIRNPGADLDLMFRILVNQHGLAEPLED